MDIEDRARDLFKELSLKDIEAVHRQISRNTDNMSNEEIKRDVRVYSRNSPEEFLSLVDDPSIEMDNIVARAIDENLIQFRNNKTQVHYNLKGNKKMLYRVPDGENPEESLNEFLTSNEGVEIYKELQDELEN